MRQKASLPSGISQRSNGKYWVRISYEGRQVSVGLFDTLTDAKVALTLAKADAVKGMFIPPAEKRRAAREKAAAEAARTLTLGQWAHEWLATFASLVEIGQRSKATYREYESVLSLYVLPAWAKTPLSHISPADVEKLLASILARKGTKTRNKVLRTIRPLFNAAVEQGAGGLDKSPVKSKPLKAVVDERTTATPEQVKALADAMPERLALSVYLAAWCALRQGEALGLQRRDFIGLDTPQPMLRVERQWNQKTTPPGYTIPKGKDARTISIPTSLAPLILTHLDQYVGEDPDAPVFESSIHPGRPTSQTTHNKAWKTARETTGLTTLHFHDLRHTGLTLYAQQGATVKEIMERGGHKDIEVALRYQHAASERARALADALPVQV